MGDAGMTLLMALYSLALLLLFVLGSPYWIFRMLTSGRYRAGLWGRLGHVPAQLRTAVAGKQVVWLHAVSVGEVLAATRLVRDLEEALNAPGRGLGTASRLARPVGADWIIVVSTTTATGQALARGRFGDGRVFWYPLDFAWAVRAYLRVLQPRMLVLMESELWPRMLTECERNGVPVAVVNARVSDRSSARGLKVQSLWQHVLRRISLFLAQSEEDAGRLQSMGARAVQTTGNLKYDVSPPKQSAVAQAIGTIAAGRPVVVAGSTVEAEGAAEEDMVLEAWRSHVLPTGVHPVLVLAPRHPQRFEQVASMLSGYNFVRASEITQAVAAVEADIILLDTIGDLAAVYGIASVAFIGGSLAVRGGHNPLEAARFGVPVLTGPSTTNFREVYARLSAANGVVTLSCAEDLGPAIANLLQNPAEARAIGEPGRQVYEQQQGATARTVTALIQLIQTRRSR
jgi:3-deoxy-D-manno-octulosonic-acid transferase